MSFKRLGIAFVSLSIAWAGLTACTPTIGEKPPEPKDFELAATKCLNKAALDLKGFFDANVEDAHLIAAWTCVETAFLQFEKYVVGKEQDRYTSQEIVTFLENNFFEDASKNKITPELQVEIMKLKQIFLGGDTKFITRDELRKSQGFLQQISRMTTKLNPHMKIIMMEWKPQLDTVKSQDLVRFEAANGALQEFAVELATLILKNASLYRIDDLVVLFKEFEKFFDADWDWVDDVKNLIPGGKKLKVALAGGDENTVNQKEWNPVLTLGARGYFQYLRYHYFIKTTHETGGAIRLVYVARTLEDVFSIFQDLVSRKDSGAVTAREVFEILNAFEQFWTELKTSEKLIHEFMKIKQVLIGGSVDMWTAVDFEQARLKIPELRRIIENFMPYFSIYSSEWDPEMEEPEAARETFEQARVKLAVVAQDFGRFLRGSYSYDDLIELIKEINRLYPNLSTSTFFSGLTSETPGKKAVKNSQRDSQNKKSLPDTIQQYREVFLEAKKMIYNEPDTIIRKDQWAQVMPLVSDIFSLYQYYDYFITDKNVKQTQTIKDMGTMVDHGVSFARNLFNISHKGYFDQNELVSLTLKLSETDLLGENKLKPDTATGMWKALLQYILFSPERRLQGEKNDRLSIEQVAILQAELKIWMKTQIALNDIFKNNPDTAFSPVEMMKNIKDKYLQVTDDPELRAGLEGVYSLLDSSVTSTWDSEDHLEISNRVEWKYRLNALFQANMTRALTRLLMRSFSNEPTFHRINQCDTQSAFNLLAGIFRDLKVFDPPADFVSSRFLESNIFLGRANGDKYLEYYELGDLINVVFSGLRINDKLEKSLRNICKVEKTPEGKEFVTFKCMSEHHYVMVRKHMTQLPDYKAYVDKLASKDKGESTITIALQDDDLTIEQPPDEDGDGRAPPVEPIPKKGARPGFDTWNRVFKETLKATGWEPNTGYGRVKEESVELDAALYYPFVVQYTELLYSRFDYTKNGYLQSFEAKKAFPIFRPLLKEVADGAVADDELLALFTYILRYKEQPSLGSFVKWLLWKNNEKKWEKEVWVGRTDIAQILGFIADKAKGGDSGGAPVCR